MTDKKKKTTNKKYLDMRDDPADSRTVAAKQRVRTELQAEIEEFLKRGGTIQHVEPHVSGESVTENKLNYGERSI